jgi:hypothetical protein
MADSLGSESPIFKPLERIIDLMSWITLETRLPEASSSPVCSPETNCGGGFSTRDLSVSSD